ncbi:MAG: protein kinase [Acidobacteriia bacterium]|nr:protein kinase [Terriglobia bacterium]
MTWKRAQHTIRPIMQSSPASLILRMLGHYRIIEQIGAGGMGVVYRARDERLDRDVAVKVLPPGTLADDSARKRFRKEALALSRLNHPNIATVHDFDSEAGIDFLVTELVPGMTLDEKLRAGALPEQEVVRIGMQMADGLVAAHREGVIHRDLKPGNLRLTPEGRLKILDFGLAKRVDPVDQGTITQSIAEAGGAGGTLPYMAPEQLKGEKEDTRSDLWAAGVVLYEMATGRRPFEGKTTIALADEIVHAPPPSPQGLQPRLSPRLADIILKCLEKNAENRYQSAKELLVDLRRLAMPTPLPAAAVTPLGHPASRHRGWATAAALGSVALAIVLLAMFQARKAKQVPESSRAVSANRLSTGGAASAFTEANEYFEKAMLLLKAQYDLKRAREMLERALRIDPHFAEARAWYGFSDVLMVDGGSSNDSNWFYKAEQEARRALEDDPNSGRAHSALAAAYLLQGRKELVPMEVEQALAANRADLDARVWLINYYRLNGNYSQAEVVAKQALDMDPLFFPARMNLGDAFFEQGNVDEAVRQYEKIFEVDSLNHYAITRLTRAFMSTGDLPKARRMLDLVRSTERKNFETRLAWALLFALEGNKEAATEEMDSDLETYAQISVWSTLPVAEFYSITGDTQKSLQWLERAVRSGDERVEWFRRDSLLSNVRKHPRFQQIVESTAYRQQQRRPPAPLP